MGLTSPPGLSKHLNPSIKFPGLTVINQVHISKNKLNVGEYMARICASGGHVGIPVGV